MSTKTKSTPASRKPRSSAAKVGGISDAAVAAKTGKTWPEWLAALDARGCRKLSHREIAQIVADDFGIGPWWQQMVAVGYEQARGLRQKHEMPDGYQISRSKTLASPADTVFAAWSQKRRRNRWLPDTEFVIRSSQPGRLLRITWIDGTSHVEVRLTPKSDEKTQITVQHSKLPDARAGERMKSFWGEALERLRQVLEE
jgi:uncharacterized protein YndB with AHSA1/START domain